MHHSAVAVSTIIDLYVVTAAVTRRPAIRFPRKGLTARLESSVFSKAAEIVRGSGGGVLQAGKDIEYTYSYSEAVNLFAGRPLRAVFASNKTADFEALKKGWPSFLHSSNGPRQDSLRQRLCKNQPHNDLRDGRHETDLWNPFRAQFRKGR